MTGTVHLAGSATPHPSFASFAATARPLTDAELARPASVTVHLRESPHTESMAVALARQQHTPVQTRRYPSAVEFADAHGCAAADVALVTRWASVNGLHARRSPHSPTTLELRGAVGALARAFEVSLERRRERDMVTGALAVYRDHRDELSVPIDLDGVITAALGLSDRPVGTPRLAVLPRGRQAVYTYTPEELAQIYDFPMLADGGRGLRITVGIAELGGAVHRPDVAAFTARNPRLRVIEEAVHGWGPSSDPFGPDTEVALDWQVIAGILGYCAPQADVLVVIKYAPNTDRGFSNLEVLVCYRWPRLFSHLHQLGRRRRSLVTGSDERDGPRLPDGGAARHGAQRRRRRQRVDRRAR